MVNRANRARLWNMTGAVPVLAAWLPMLCWGQSPVAESPDAPIALREGRAVTTSQRAGQRSSFVFEAAAGETYLIELQQLGLDFIVTVNEPLSGARSYDSPLLRDERDLVLLENTAPGAYVLTVHSEEHTGAAGSHAIQLARLDSGVDSRVIDAWSSMSGGGAANHEGGERGRNDAIAAYDAAAELWRQLGRDRERAQALYSMAALEYQGANWNRSAELASTASELYAGLGQDALSAGADRRRAAALIEMATNVDEATPELRRALFDDALSSLERARRIHEQLGNRYEVGLVINDMGLAHHVMGTIQQAETFWREATILFRELDEWGAELKSLGNQAVIDVEEGQLLDAIETFERIVDILPAGKLESDRAWTLSNLAATHRLFGNFEQALQTYSSALDLHRENGDLRGEAYSLRGIGQAYYGLGELDLATEYLESALPKAQEVNDGRGHEAAVRYLGNIAFLKREYDAALDYHEAALKLATSPLDVAYLEVSLAKDLNALERHAEAKSLADRARATAEATETRLLLADALQALGRARSELGDDEAAMEDLEQARSLYASLELRGAEADALNALASAARDQGRLEAALRYGEASLEAIEDLRARISHPELRAFNAALRRTYFDTQIDLLMALHRASNGSTDRHLREAFAVSERARTRMLVDLLHEASVDLGEGMDPALTARRNRFYERLAERSSQRDALVNQAATAPDAKDRLASVMNDMRALENQLNLVETELRRANPRYASLSAPQTLAAAEVQALLDPHTILLQYALGDERSYAWLLTHDDILAVELAGRETIESAARQAFDSLSTYRPDNRAARQSNDALAELSALVLAPLADLITKDRILVASSGALQYVPFGVLPAPDSAASVLLEKYEIVAIPSMSGLAAQAAREGAAPPPKTIAVFADPVLGADDARFAGAALQAVQSGPQDRITPSPFGADLERLVWTGREASAIADLVPRDQRFVATGFAATRDAVFDMDLEQYRFLHFATHGRVDSRYPALSALILSQVDERGKPQSNLRLHDIYSLQLNADLVVLSACETALGREVRGESLIGLTQGFMYAGARSVAASLWQVPDRATAELMTRFYGYMFTAGLRPAEALRRAQLSIASERRTSDPYFWGAFILLGDWR